MKMDMISMHSRNKTFSGQQHRTSRRLRLTSSSTGTTTVALLSVFLIFCTIPIYETYAQTTAVDVARNKKVLAEITCGTNGRETYFLHSETYLRPSSRTLQTCYNISTHPASAMVDGKVDTWWQSTARGELINAGWGLNGRPEASIIIDLEQYFEVESIILTMGDSKRPGSMILYKSVDGEKYQPWIYRVTDESDCTNLYNTQISATPKELNARVCSGFANGKAAKFEKIVFDLSAVNPLLAAWRNLRYLKIEFYKMDLTLGINGVKFQHYTVSELSVKAECVCNGQAVSCQLENGTGQYQCVCGGNTTGLFCEECSPFSNQFPFRYGQPCEECNCFGHADTCFYDPVTANFSRSLDAQGVYRGGGVCNDCRDHTAGVNCHLCKPFYYRPISVDQRSVNACQPCECYGPGVATNPLTGLTGDCVMNDDKLLPIGMVPGDCICKSNVTGSKCDQCKVGFYNLDLNNPSGCTDCECNTVGTIGGTPVCNATNGQCPCKTHVDGEHCDVCKDEFYGMTMEDTDGCKPCECDTGGSISNICDKETGQCPCRTGVSGRQCNVAGTDTYSPDPHFLHGEFESIRSSWDRDMPGYSGFGYATLSQTVAALTYIEIPITKNLQKGYYLLLKYEAPHNVTGSAYIFASGVPTVSTALEFPACPSKWCLLEVGHHQLFTMVGGKTYTIRVAVDDKIKLDSGVVLPWEFTNGTAALGAEADIFHSKCDVINNNMGLGTPDESYCLTTFFSMTSFYLDGTLPCNCHLLGTVKNTTCDAYGGQCHCNTGVGGRSCHDCLLEYYNLQEGGCQPCGCGSDYKVCDSITGHCVCPPNIVGRKCDACMVNHWNWTALHGCEPCNCNFIGSGSLQCNATSGECRCKPGVAGPKCKECLPGYKSFSWTGCVPCDCSELGSTSEVCNPKTGQCPCKENTIGMHCDRCKGGTYFLQEEHHKGCLNCICMGVTGQCMSSTRRLATNTIPVMGNNNTVNFNVVTDSETSIVDISITNHDGISMATVEVGSQPRQYWAPIDGLHGNLVALFENTLTFTIYYTAADTTGLPLLNNRLILISNHKGERYYLGVPTISQGQKTEVSVKVTHENFVGLSENTTRGQLLLGLQDIQMVLIPASYYDRMHTSSIGDIKFVVASKDGTGPRALSVESCSCPAGYEGESCERCAVGYMRKNVETHEYLGVCRPCECNNHATECNADTGVCDNCRHHTSGDQCQHCSVGFYGEATMGTPYDCLPCPCYEPRVINGTCLVDRGKIDCLYCAPGYKGHLCDECDTFYWGNPEVVTFGKCEACFCNSNTEECNKQTGECLNCRHNTTGHHCQNCTDGFYGNATNQDCQPCNCDMTGSQSPICDHNSGQCECYDGVGGRTCNACLPDYYGFSNTTFAGCKECRCNEFGSANTQCDEMGKCTCKVDAQATKCDECSLGTWGLPHQECQGCACSPIGTVDLSVPCEKEMGQCVCKPGVTGRQCDRCEFLYVGFGPNGCSQCSECQYSLGNSTKELETLFDGYWQQAQAIREVQNLDSQLQVLADHISMTSADLGLSEGHLDVINEGVLNLTQAEPRFNKTVQQLLTKASLLEYQAEVLDNSSLVELKRQEEFRNVAQVAHQKALKLNTTGPATVTKLTQYKNAADNLHIDSGRSSSAINVNFDAEKKKIATAVANITTEAEQAETMLNRATSTGNITTHLEVMTSTADEQLKDIQFKVTASNNMMLDVKVRADAVADSFNTTKYYKAHAEALYTEAQTLVAMSETILTYSREAYAQARRYLDDTYSVLHGVAAGQLPVEPSVPGSDPGSLAEKPKAVDDNKLSIWSWSQASTKLRSDLNTTLTLIRSRDTEVKDMETRSKALTEHVVALKQEFDRVEPQGHAAVEAVHKYESVAQTLEKSVLLALEANRTVGEVMETLKDVSIETLEATASRSVEESQKVVEVLRQQQTAAEELQQRLLTANASLTQNLELWESRYELSSIFLKAAAAVNELAQEPLVAQPIEAAYVAADGAIATSDLVLQQVNNSKLLIQKQSQMASLVREENNNATELVATLGAQLDTFEKVVQGDMHTTLGLAETLRNDTSVLQTQIEAQMTSLEEKISRALARLRAMEQPVGLARGQHEVVENPAAGRPPSEHSQIQLSFQVTLRAEGLLFFTENNQTGERLKLALNDSMLTFTFDNGDGPISVISRADICRGCWFRVIATRLGIDGHLTVIRLNDGAIATSHQRGRTKATRMSLNTPVYVGGLPANYMTTKVTAEDGEFEGCLANVHMDGRKLPLWENVLNHQSQAQCCAKPPPPPAPPALPGAISLSGFGYYQMSALNISIATSAHVQFRFRSFDRSGVMMVVDRQLVSSYFGLYMVTGKVILQMGGLGWEESLISARTYADGQWYQLSAMYNATYFQLVVEYVDKTISPLIDVRSRKHDRTLKRLIDGAVTFGSQNPDTQSYGPVTDYFAGCFRDIKFALPGAETQLQTVDVPALSTTYGSVATKYCYTDATAGLAFTAADGYARLANIRKAVSVVEFSFQTYHPNGVIMFAQRPEGTAPYFYIAVYNGDIIVLFNQGSGVQPILRTRGLYLSDGREHDVTVEFSYQNNPRLSVNGEVHHGAVEMTPNMAIMGGPIYIGGVPSSIIQLPSQFPVRTALIGGFRKLLINTQPVDLYSPSNFDIRVQRSAWLSGLPLSPNTPPPLPYSTTPAPPTTPHPTCAAPYELSFSEKGMRFGNEAESYAAFNISDKPRLFAKSFTITIEFRAVQPNGILVYASSTPNSNPTFYFSLFLENGHLVFNMDSNSNIANANPSGTKRIRSRYTYNTGQWVEVTVLRINDFVALVVTRTRDYKNNGVTSLASSELDIQTLFYVGGVPAQFGGLPFGGDHDIPMGAVPFHGCIRSVKVATHAPEPVMFDLGSPDVAVGTLPCFDSVQPGIFFNDTTAYIRVQRPASNQLHNVVPNFRFNVTFHGTSKDGALLAAYGGPTKFFVVELFEGQVRGILSDGHDPSHPFIFTTSVSSGSLSFCDNTEHSIEVGLTFGGAEVVMDKSDVYTFEYPQGYLFTPIYSQPVYVGGHPPGSNWVFPTEVTRLSYHGCIDKFFMNGEEYILAQMDEAVGVFAGCPAAPPAA